MSLDRSRTHWVADSNRTRLETRFCTKTIENHQKSTFLEILHFPRPQLRRLKTQLRMALERSRTKMGRRFKFDASRNPFPAKNRQTKPKMQFPKNCHRFSGFHFLMAKFTCHYTVREPKRVADSNSAPLETRFCHKTIETRQKSTFLKNLHFAVPNSDLDRA